MTVREKNGRWYYRITISQNGKKKYLERGSYSTKEEALDAGMKHEQGIKNSINRKEILFRDLAQEWITWYETKVCKRTVNKHRRILKYTILPELKNYHISKIDSEMLQTMVEQRTTLYLCFDYALMKGYVSENPVYDVIKAKNRVIYQCTTYYTKESIKRLKQPINVIFDRFQEGHPYYIPLLLGFRYGLSIEEIFGLYIDDVDRKNHQLYIRRKVKDELYLIPCEEKSNELDTDTWRILTKHINKIVTARPIMNHVQYYILEGKINQTKGMPIYLLNVRPSDGSYISIRSMEYTRKVIRNEIDPSWKFSEFRSENFPGWDF